MAENEYSMLWATGTSADGADGYTAEEARQLWRAMYSNGVLKGYLNDLAVSTTGANNITVATGAAIIQGMPYFSIGDAVSKTVSTPAAGTTGLRIVLRVDWVGVAESAVTPPLYAATTQYTIRVLVISNADGTAAIPAATTTDGTCYDLTLATATIAQTTGIITITDARTYSAARGETATAGIADSAVTAAKIANRTRKFLVEAPSATEGTGIYQATYTYLHLGEGGTSPFGAYRVCNEDDSGFWATAHFLVPADYSSTMTVKALIYNTSSNTTIRSALTARYLAVGESQWTGTFGGTDSTVSLSSAALNAIQSTTLTGIEAYDIVELIWYADSSHPGWTAVDVNGQSPILFYGFQIEYTADS